MNFSDPQPPLMTSTPYKNPIDPMSCWAPQMPMASQNLHTHLDFQAPVSRPRVSDDGLTHSRMMNNNNNDNQYRMNQSNQGPTMGKRTADMFYKTRICTSFMLGTCQNGDRCTYAHGEGDLRQPLPNWEEYDNRGCRGGNRNGDGNDNGDMMMSQRIKICKKYYNGEECPYGKWCNFFHKDPPGKVRDVSVVGRFRDDGPRESSAISIGTTARPPPVMPYSSADHGNNSVHLSGDPPQRPVYWKTKICSKWELGGCPYGEKCHYAHGQAELQVYVNCVAESEPTNATSIVAKPNPVVVVAEFINEMTDVPKQVDEGKERLLKWKLTKKINSIYADWIDDRSLIMPSDI
ncbi:hypothetical protein Droror1_Dr00023806 [Drosera rotundifolia]